MARIIIEAHVLDEIREALAKRCIDIEEKNPPWEYVFTGTRDALTGMLQDFWGLTGKDLQDVLNRIED